MQSRCLRGLIMLWFLLLVGCSSAVDINIHVEPPTVAATGEMPSITPTIAPSLASATPSAAASATAISPTDTPYPTPTGTPESPTPTPQPPTATPPPTSTPFVPPTPTPTPIRIQFAPGSVSATVPGQIVRSQPDGVEIGQAYVLRALAGQTMEVRISSPHHDVLLEIVGADGVPLKRYVDGRSDWRGTLLITQDYYIYPISVGGSTSFELYVWVSPLQPPGPIRIQFAPGATSATVRGQIARTQPGDAEFGREYIVRVLGSQTMEVRITSPHDDVLLSIRSADGMPIKRYIDGRADWRGVIPSTQDYIITPVSVGGSTDFEVYVWIGAISLPPPVRVQFASGATSATVHGTLGANEAARYVLRARAGQMMEVHALPSGGIAIAVSGQDGSFWSAPAGVDHLMIPSLPRTQDYVITLTVVPPAGAIAYTMEVRIPPP